ncbi:MAG: class I SAM-dependent methyltransferase [Sporolactobacillus sp.]
MLFAKLIDQSKKPEGMLGKIMMKLWNKTYFTMTKWGLGFASIPQKEAIVDIGVGNGLTTHYLSQQAPSGSITGIDISKTAIAVARKNNSAENIAFSVMSVADMSFSDQSFDLVTAFQTHFHWPSYIRGLEEIYRVLKDNGQVVIACERMKLNYFLSDNQNGELTQKAAQIIGYRTFEKHYYRRWLCYYLTK